MMTEDLKALAQLGQALWADPNYAERVSVETLTAVSLQHLTEERTLERVSTALYQRASRDGLDVNSAAIHLPFYRLLPEERLILAALHGGHWSYARLGRILGLDADRVAEIAWSARLSLATAVPGAAVLAHPTGSRLGGASCPEYDAHRPWTQRFVDNELPPREKHFLQNHMGSCDACRRALVQCKNLYYRVGSLIPGSPIDPTADTRARNLGQAFSYAEEFKRPSERSFGGSLRIFARRREVQVATAIGVFCALRILFRG